MSHLNLLSSLNKSELETLANGTVAPEFQAKLSDLLAKQNEGKLSQEEGTQLDDLMARVDQLMLVKAKAMYTLHQLTTK